MFVGPFAPDGYAANWAQSHPSVGFFVYLRLMDRPSRTTTSPGSCPTSNNSTDQHEQPVSRRPSGSPRDVNTSTPTVTERRVEGMHVDARSWRRNPIWNRQYP